MFVLLVFCKLDIFTNLMRKQLITQVKSFVPESPFTGSVVGQTHFVVGIWSNVASALKSPVLKCN